MKLGKYYKGSFVTIDGVKYEIISICRISVTKKKETIYTLISNEGKKIKINILKNDLKI